VPTVVPVPGGVDPYWTTWTELWPGFLCIGGLVTYVEKFDTQETLCQDGRLIMEVRNGNLEEDP
jgi:hypothetical protein